MKKSFPKIKGKVRFKEPLSRHTTFRIGGPCGAWVEPAGEGELRQVLEFARAKRKNIFVMGMGSNVLVRDRGFNGIVIHLGNKHFKNVSLEGTRIRAGAGARLGHVCDFACNNGLAGMEGLVGIPGTLGGAIFMNSSYRDEISGRIEKVKVINKLNSEIEVKNKKDINFGYRQSDLDKYIILEATLKLKKGKKTLLVKRKKELFEMKRRKHPFWVRSAGSVFKNPSGKISAAYCIDKSNLKGARIGGAKVSEKHANFIVNMKNAKEKDVTRLMRVMQRRVKSRFNVNLVPEVKVL